MREYAETYRSFRWELPRRFNFGVDVVDAWAREPGKLALMCCDDAGLERRYTFAEIAALSDRAAAALAARGVRKGERCIVMLPRLAQWQVAMVGCLKLGAIPIPCIEMLTQKDIAFRATHAGAVAAVATNASAHKFDALPGVRVRLAVGGAQGWEDFDAVLAASDAHIDAAEIEIEEPVVMFYTSGSTGNPKGVTHAARALYAWRLSSLYWHDLGPGDLIWCTADTGWSKAGTAILYGPWSCGAAVLFHNGGFDPQQRLELLARHRVTVFCAAATEFRRLINEDLSRHDLSALRLAVSAGETVNPEVVRRWTQLTGVPLLDGYGQTETLMTVLNYPCLAVKPGSMGRPLPGIETLVLDAAHRPLRGGASGQLAVRLPNAQMMLGYWNEPERTAAGKVRVDGDEYWLTGDVVREDGDGYLFYEGRADDIISSAGYRVGPMEVESALLEHPAVQESAAVAKPDAERGEIVKVFVVLKTGYAADQSLAQELQEHVKSVTAPYKYPREIAFVGELPKNASGKLLRRVLRDQEYAAAAKGAE
ncbi:MAG: AMP-binding protein [Betaproteobacteria bacterium]|nr:AMP-binding protein [Betaproteobacteria bacterium]